MLKDIIYLGLGGALLAREKMMEELEEMVEKGKIAKDDARKLAESAKERGEEEEKKLKESIASILKEVLEEMNLATKEDIERIEKKLSEKM
jgi:polyhydroxyalkanoate synthesis regulator phasin